jgi:ubiquinone/menaquinone biosynthesis C-methylase UbiE
MTETDVKQRVRQFYDRVGWQVEKDGHYQNARYEDLRPVAAEYIHRCHLRVKRHLKPDGRFLLDAGSGPVQYVEYLTYSEGYQYRVCVDISIVALQEARQRLESHGLYVVADVANLPFKPEPFEGVVSLHTLHHLPLEDQSRAYGELYRVLKPGGSAVVVNGWTDSALMRRSQGVVRLMERAGAWWARRKGGQALQSAGEKLPAAGPQPADGKEKKPEPAGTPSGTFIRKQDAAWLRRELGGQMNFKIYSWRSVSVRFLRAMVHAPLGGRFWLRLLYWLEEAFPRFFGEKGQYPLIVIRK